MATGVQFATKVKRLNQGNPNFRQSMDICGGFAGSENKHQASVGWLEVAPCQAAEAHLISGNLDCELQPSNNLTTSPKFQHFNYFNIKFQRARES